MSDVIPGLTCSRLVSSPSRCLWLGTWKVGDGQRSHGPDDSYTWDKGTSRCQIEVIMAQSRSCTNSSYCLSERCTQPTVETKSGARQWAEPAFEGTQPSDSSYLPPLTCALHLGSRWQDSVAPGARSPSPVVGVIPMWVFIFSFVLQCPPKLNLSLSFCLPYFYLGVVWCLIMFIHVFL